MSVCCMYLCPTCFSRHLSISIPCCVPRLRLRPRPRLVCFPFSLFCSVLQEISARFLFSYGPIAHSSSWIFPYKQVLLFLYPVEVSMYYLCPYVLHFPLHLDIRYLCVHLPHRFAVLLASLRPEENYMFWFLTENCWATAPYGGDRAEQSLIESNCSLELFKQSILMTHSKQSSNFMYSNLFKTDLMKGCPRSSHDTIGQPFSRSFNQLPL